MAEIGKINTLKVVRETDNGLYLDGEQLGEILMPQKFITEETRKTNQATVFIYTDSEDRLGSNYRKTICKGGRICKTESGGNK